MRIYTKAGDLAFSFSKFPDGQPHFTLETYELDFRSVTIEMAITSPADLFNLLLANDALRRHGYAEINLDIRYLMGARMDRPIDPLQPFTLDLVSRLVNGAGFNRVRILDVHSPVALKLIRNSTNVLPYGTLFSVGATTYMDSVVIPDNGAVERVEHMFNTKWPTGDTELVYCQKTRDMATGNLSGFKIHEGIPGRSCLIVDDICDGGGTFVGLAKVLREAGAKTVHLFVTHGIFSKLTPLEGIDRIFTTDSYAQYPRHLPGVTVIPVSMEKL